MPPMSIAHGRDTAGVAGSSEPVVYGRANPSAHDRRLARPMMARNQQQHPITPSKRLLQRPVDRGPGVIQVHTMKIERAIRLHRPRTQPPLPVAVKQAVHGCRRLDLHQTRSRRRHAAPHSRRRRHGKRRLRGSGTDRLLRGLGSRLSGQRADGRGHPPPEFRFFSGELAHGRFGPARPFPWAAGLVPRPWPPSRRPPALHKDPHPRRYRRDWHP